MVPFQVPSNSFATAAFFGAAITFASPVRVTRVNHAAFVDAQGKPLSDHYPIATRFDWTASDDIRAGGVPWTSRTSATRTTCGPG